MLKIQSKTCHTYNTIINDYPDFREVIFYKDSFKVFRGSDLSIDINTGEVFKKEIDRTRKFKQINGVLVPTTSSATIDKLSNTIKQSRKRALDNLFGFALSNDWQYFLTLTFSPEFVDRDNEEDIKYTYSKFRQTLQYYNADVKILAIPERHPTSGQLHFHCLIGNICLNDFLTKAINPHTNKPIKSNGRQVYNLNLFKFGFSTLVKIGTGEDNRIKVVNYLSKYIVKDFGNIGYNKKTYFHTTNLNFKNKQFFMLDENDYSFEFMQDCKYKENEKMIVYRLPVLG